MGTPIGEIIEKEEIELEYLSGKKLGVDAFNSLYQFLSIIRSRDGEPLKDAQGNITSHLAGLLYRTTNLVERGLKPVFVFDGKPHELKEETREKRKEIRTEAEKKFQKAKKEGKLEEARKYAQQAVKLTDEMIQESKELISLMGLPVVQAPSEGEAQIAFMVESKDLFGCVSQDFDALLFGTPVLLRNITVSGKRKVPGKNFYIEVSPEKIELEKVLKKLKINRKKLVWIGILVGTDFNKKFPKIGPKTALNLVQKFDSFEEIIKETKFKPDFNWKRVEEIFLKPSYSKDYKIEFFNPKKEKILDFLCEKHQFSKERVEKAIEKIQTKAEEKGEQVSLQKWLK